MVETPVTDAKQAQPPSAPVPAPDPPPRLSLRPVTVALLLITGAVLGIGGYAGYMEYSAAPSVSSYEECVESRGSRIQESYPSTCVTRDGKRFTQPGMDDKQPTATPTTDPTARWHTYANAVRGYSIRYPGDWTLDSSKAETPITDARGATLVIRKGDYMLRILWPSAYGPGICIFDDQTRIGAPEMASYCEGSFTDISSADGAQSYRRLQTPEKLADHVQWEIYAKKNDAYVTVPPTSYRGPLSYDASTIRILDTILASFTQTPPSTSAFTCPKTQWVNCMPGPNTEGIKFECTEEFLTWATASCPGFRGAAW